MMSGFTVDAPVDEVDAEGIVSLPRWTYAGIRCGSPISVERIGFISWNVESI